MGTTRYRTSESEGKQGSTLKVLEWLLLIFLLLACIVFIQLISSLIPTAILGAVLCLIRNVKHTKIVCCFSKHAMDHGY